MMLHRHFEEPKETKTAEDKEAVEANKSGATAEGADIVAEPAKPKRTTRKKTSKE